jgi:kynurenine formamidase
MKQALLCWGKPGGGSGKEFPDEMGLTLERLRIITHSGTHIDAPVHYGSICEGKKAKIIEDLPLEWFFNAGIVIDARGPDEIPVTIQEVKEPLAISVISSIERLSSFISSEFMTTPPFLGW